MTVEENVIKNFMGKSPEKTSLNNTPVSHKKQTSLLSFFSSPTPKRASAPPESNGGTLESPLKKKSKDLGNTSLLCQPDLLYEMISEDGIEDTDQILHKQSLSMAPKNFDGYMLPSESVFSSTELDSSCIGLRKCKVESMNHQYYEGEEDDVIPESSTKEERYSWLLNIRDAEGRPPSDPLYDPRTLYIPPSSWTAFTPFERQYWELKKNLFDTVVFFKKGKFYELYEMDADIGSREFDLKMIDRVNMRMVGVPEASYEMWASRFVAAGYKVARVDQTETAVGKSIREKDAKVKSKEDKIIKRELTCILTAGTITEPSMINGDEGQFCLAIKECVSSECSTEIPLGLAILDASIASFRFSDFVDDANRTMLETILIQLQPKEILLEKGKVSIDSKTTIKRALPNARITEFAPGKDYPGRDKTIELLDTADYFSNCDWPLTLKKQCDQRCLSFEAFGALLVYLRSLKLDKSLISQLNFSPFDAQFETNSLIIDGNSLINLDVVPSCLRSSVSVADPKKGTLLSIVDFCSTGFGRRRLNTWVCHPLRSAHQIRARQGSVMYLLNNARVANELRNIIRALPDMERALSQVHSCSIKTKDFLALFDAFRRVQNVGIMLMTNNCDGALLCAARAYPRIDQVLDEIEDAYNLKRAQETGETLSFVHPL